jgi:hypothetical protein
MLEKFQAASIRTNRDAHKSAVLKVEFNGFSLCA